MNQKNVFSGSSLIFLGALLFGAQAALNHLGGSFWLFGGEMRCLFLVVLVMTFFSEGRSIPPVNRLTVAVGLSSVGCAYLFPAGYAYTSTATAISIAYAGMLICPLVDWAFRGIPVSKAHSVLLGIAAIGVVCVAAGTEGSETTKVYGILAAVGAAISWAVFSTGNAILGSRENVRIFGSPMKVLTWANVIGALGGLAVLAVIGGPIGQSTKWYVVVGSTSSLAFLFFALGIKSVSPVRRSLISMIEIPAAIAGTFVVLHEPISALQIAGCIFIIFANVVSTLMKTEEEVSDAA